MTESQLITLGWCYEIAHGKKAESIRQLFTKALDKLTTTESRQHYIYLFNQGRQEARQK
jgi:hypothetical protein